MLLHNTYNLDSGVSVVRDIVDRGVIYTRSHQRKVKNLLHVEILNPNESTESNIHSRALVTSIRGPNTGPSVLYYV